MQWNEDEEPVDLAAGNGISFVVTRLGNILSWGNGRFGALGHGDEESSQQPREIHQLRKITIAAVACGYYHAIATSQDGILLQLGPKQQRTIVPRLRKRDGRCSLTRWSASRGQGQTASNGVERSIQYKFHQP